MRLKNCFCSILCLFIAICEIESRPQFFFDTINKIKEKGAEIGCKLNKFSHKSDPCAAQPDTNNGGVKPISGVPNNQNLNGNAGPNYSSGQNDNTNQAGYANQNLQHPNQERNTGLNNQISNQKNNNFQPEETKTSAHSSNGIVFPEQVEKPKPSIHNSQQGPGGRTVLGKPNQSSSGQQPDARDVIIASTAASTTSTTTVRSKQKKLNHSSRRKQSNSDYSDEDEDSEERSKKKKKILDSTPEPESEENVAGVTDGRSLIGKVKTNCPEGYKADRKGICREAY